MSIELVEGVEVELTKHCAGVVGVDSGQAMICDPTNIGQWKGNDLDPSFIERKLEDTVSGIIYTWPTDFKSYEWCFDEFAEVVFVSKDEVDPSCDKPTVNELVESGRFEHVVSDNKKPNGEFSYDGCCRATLAESFGQLKYERGHDGAGVVFNTGCGDGVYPVYVYTADVPGWGNRVVKVEICFFEEEDVDE
jgi:hypothetical protein